MFFKILKKDLKRKKNMNIILFMFMILIGMLVTASSNILYTVTSALNNFAVKSKVADLIVVSYSNKENNKEIEAFKNNSFITDMKSDNAILLESQNFIAPKKYKDTPKLFLTAAPCNYNLLYNNDNKLLSVNDNEIAIPISICENTNIKLGDKVTISLGNLSKSFKVKYYVKDVAMGPNLTGTKRIVVSSNNFKYFSQYKDIVELKIYSFEKSKKISYSSLDKAFSKQVCANVIANITSNNINQIYISDFSMAGLMIFVSIFLILIAFLILRFTIVFTLKEEYKEIGVMKAIGLKNKNIANLYLIKYLFLSVIGSGIGLILSFPLANEMLKSISKNIIITKSPFTIVLVILSVSLVILITLLFCKMCTRKINKFSAIEAIRNGSNGERFSKSKKISLYKHRKFSVPFFMAISDLINEWKKFAIVIISFMLGTNLILVPINLINTLNSDNMLQYFCLGKNDVFIKSDSVYKFIRNNNIDKLLIKISDFEKKYSDNGCKIKLHPECYYKGKAYIKKDSDSKNVLALKGFDYNTDNYVYTKGTAPKLENEIAISSCLASYFNIGIGDKLHFEIADKSYDFIITSLYESMNNLGYSIRFSEKVPIKLDGCFGMDILGSFINTTNKTAAIQKLRKITPKYTIETSGQYVSSEMGNISDQLNLVKALLLIIILGINLLITVLFVKMLLSKELAEVAILKSIGFKNRTIKCWQVTRFLIVALISVILGTITSKVFGEFLTGFLFKSIGVSNFKLVIMPFQIYFMYPMIILSVILAAAVLSLGHIKKINVFEINNQE